MSKKLNLIGRRFGRLKVVEFDTARTDRTRWLCICKCGAINVSIQTSNLIEGRQTSCGCLKKELIKKRCWKGVGSLSGSYWNQVTMCATTRQIPINITIKDAWKQFSKQKGKCALTGEDITLSKCKAESEQTASLDRIDSSKGYVKGNIQWVHKTIQKMKMELEQYNFINWCKKVANKP